MTNNNLADISMFESLQSEQHHRTNMSSMSVFNDAQEIAKAAKKLNEIDKEYAETKKKLESLENTGKHIFDMYSRLSQKQQRYIAELKAVIAKGGTEAQQAAKKLESEQLARKDVPGLPHFSFKV
jgi:DNA-binding transcriptional regulator GbsR (MarR family)